MKTLLLFFGIFILTILFSCNQYKLLEQKKDGQGRIVYKKFRQFIRSEPGHADMATITREYDTLGRVVKEYGYDNPIFQTKQYLTETSYKNKSIFVFNIFIWNDVDSTAFLHDYKKNFSKETVYIDSLTRIEIRRNKDVINKFLANYQIIPSQNVCSWSDFYNLDLPWDSVRFDNDNKLMLDNLDIKIK